MPAFIKFDGIDGEVESRGPQVRVFDGADSLVFESEGAAAPGEILTLGYTRIDLDYGARDPRPGDLAAVPEMAGDDVVVDGTIITAEDWGL